MTERERRWLIGALAFTLVVRVALALTTALVRRDVSAFFTFDSAHYMALATSLAAAHGFGTAAGPELWRVPGFPLLVALGTWLGHPVAVTLGLHAILGVLTTLLCFLAAREIGGSRLGVSAAILYACEPGQWIWSTLMLSETLFTAAVAGGLYAACRYVKHGRLAALLAAVCSAALSAYVRTPGYFLPWVVLIAAVWMIRARVPRATLIQHTAAAAATIVVVLGAWHIRNGLVAGYWGFSIQFDRAMYYMGGGSVVAQERGVTYFEARDALKDELGTNGTRASDASAMRQRGVSLVASRPLAFLSSYAAGVVSVLTHPGTGGFIRLLRGGIDDLGGDSGTMSLTLGRWQAAWSAIARKGIVYWLVTIPLLLINIFYWLLAFSGFRSRPRAPALALAATVIVYFVAVSGGPDADSRRRAPIVPAICVLAAFGYRRV